MSQTELIIFIVSVVPWLGIAFCMPFIATEEED